MRPRIRRSVQWTATVGTLFICLNIQNQPVGAEEQHSNEEEGSNDGEALSVEDESDNEPGKESADTDVVEDTDRARSEDKNGDGAASTPKISGPLHWKFGYVLIAGGVLVLFVFLLMIWDLRKAYKASDLIQRSLLAKLAPNTSPEKLGAFAAELAKTTPGIPGLARSALAFAILFILGFVIFHLVTFGDIGFKSGESGKLVHDLVMLLAGGLTSITGFYFGGRAAQASTSGAAPAAPAQSTPTATIADVQPNQAQAGQPVTILGAHFGDGKGQVKFGDKDAEIASWSDTEIEVVVPQTNPGPVTVAVNPKNSNAVVWSSKFTVQK